MSYVATNADGEIVGASFWAPCNFHVGVLAGVRAGMASLFLQPRGIARVLGMDALALGERSH